MLGIISKYLDNVTILRRLLFAVMFLPNDLPEFWKIVLEFATFGEDSCSINEAEGKLIMENLWELNQAAFLSDETLKKQFLDHEFNGKMIGMPLISMSTTCLKCEAKLAIRTDRSAPLIIYDDHIGTILGCHYHKTCSNAQCSYVQYYGYFSYHGHIYFNEDWQQHDYFVSSRETAFQMDFLMRLKADVLIGHISFQQRAEMYNYVHVRSINDK